MERTNLPIDEYALSVPIEDMPAILIALRRYISDIATSLHTGKPIAKASAMAATAELLRSLRAQRDAQDAALNARDGG